MYPQGTEMWVHHQGTCETLQVWHAPGVNKVGGPVAAYTVVGLGLFRPAYWIIGGFSPCPA